MAYLYGEKFIKEVSRWLVKRNALAGTDGFVLGVSGGIDSAVLAHILKETGVPFKLVYLPCNSSEFDRDCAMTVAYDLKEELIEINLSETRNTLINSIKFMEDSIEEPLEIKRLTDANIRARLRMTTLYAIANEFNMMVLGTDNAAEELVGYFTKFGDGGVDLLPLVDLTKAEVYELGKLLGVNEKVLNRAPSAGLWVGQTDESEMGVTYSDIDNVLKVFYSDQESLKYTSYYEACEKGLDLRVSKESYYKIVSMYIRSEHKRRMPYTLNDWE